MSETSCFTPGGYRFAKGVFQYSAGVAAEPGFEIVRARFRQVVPLAEGFDRIEQHLRSVDRPMAALCACELRSPRPFDEQGFLEFNRRYIAPLQAWGVIQHGVNPVARSNVCPIVAPPDEPGLYAFSYTVAAPESSFRTFVIAGGAEAPEGRGSYRTHTIRLGDQSADAIREKACWVLGEMERRMALLGFDWKDTTATHLYTAYDIHHILEDEIVRRHAADAGLTWQYCRPPVDVLDYEMDTRAVRREIIL